jgi:hypothetical protein
MDPQSTWDQLLAAFASGDWDLIEQRATDLIAWLDRGGFPPIVLPRSELGEDGNRVLTRAGCLFALETVQGAWRTR